MKKFALMILTVTFCCNFSAQAKSKGQKRKSVGTTTCSELVAKAEAEVESNGNGTILANEASDECMKSASADGKALFTYLSERCNEKYKPAKGTANRTQASYCSMYAAKYINAQK